MARTPVSVHALLENQPVTIATLLPTEKKDVFETVELDKIARRLGLEDDIPMIHLTSQEGEPIYIRQIQPRSHKTTLFGFTIQR